MDYGDVTGLLGAGMLLLAFLLFSAKRFGPDSRTYFLMNLAGAGLLAYSAVLLDSYPFMLLEGAWGAIALVGLAKTIKKKR